MIIVLKQDAPDVQVREFCHELEGILFQYDDHTANLLYRYGREGPPLRGLQYGTSVS